MVLFKHHKCGFYCHDIHMKKVNTPSYDSMVLRDAYKKGVIFITTVKKT